MKKGLYAGSFDPITNGHMDVIERSARLVDELTIGVMVNLAKKPLFSPEERKEMIEGCISHLPNVRVEAFGGLMADYVRMHQIDIVIRGLRASMDFEYEMQMANINARMWQNVETIFLMSRPDYTFVSSSTVKELYAFNGDIRGLVPESVLGYMEKKYDR